MKFNHIFLFLFVILSKQAYSQEAVQNNDTVDQELSYAVASEKAFDFFDSEEPLQVTLTFDVREFIKSKNNPKYNDAILTLETNSGNFLSQRIKIKARGEMRRSYCSFPPIMLKFISDDGETAQIQGKGKLKLVTPCHQSVKYENYVFKEYLAYKLFNHVTPYSFKTRLVKINYVDINRPSQNHATFGFLIENEEKMAERNQAVVLDTKYATQKQMLPEDMARVALFNYMIGNTDWSVPAQHNTKILKSMTVPSEKGIPVAYDFDFSGFVNASYAAPNEELPIETVNDRYYLGFCYSKEELDPIIEEFGERKELFLNTISNFEYLPTGTKKQLTSYINSFYKVYKYENVLISDLNRTCKRF
jgi:hypothetical protein